MSETKPKSALAEVIQHWLTSCLDATEPPSKTPEDLQSDSRTFFRYLAKNTQVVTDGNVVLQTKSSHEEALAQLIQDLGPAFSQDHHRARLRALCVLTGAIDGCKETRLSGKIVKLLGQFMLSHCGPVNDDEYAEDYDSMIRDAAIMALSSLVTIPTSSSQANDELAEAMITRMDLARTAIRRRCAVPETEDSPGPYDFERRAVREDIRGGLSTLPRSKRAMCFDLLQKTVTGISPLYKQMDAPIQKELVLTNLQIQMVEFAKFSANCLQGESDPRCLQQLLKLIYKLQVALAPWFSKVPSSPEVLFPTEDIFDAVSPYFPIQFTPPPNDVHGITREGLHNALISVLTFTKFDASVSKFNRRPIMSLSADLFLESLLPAPEDDNPGPLDKQEALECLSALLFPDDHSRAIDMMETRIAVSLSNALKATHDEASLGVAKGGQMGSENKALADSCRAFVSRIAFELEQSSNKELWEAFVNRTLLSLAPKIKDAPSSSKTSIAYIACLTSSGGIRTLRACLSMGLQPLLDFLQQKMGDNEDTAVATHGIGAFCSSCQVAMDRATKQGVVLHPHPLEVYSEQVAIALLNTLDNGDLSPAIRIGSTRGLECLLVAGGVNQLSDSTIDRVCAFLDKLSRDVAIEEGASELTHAYSTALGNVIGRVLDKSSTGSGALLHSPKLEAHISQKVYPSLLPDAGSSSTGPDIYGLKVLSIAGSTSIEVAEPIIESCLAILQKSLVEKGVVSSLPAAKAVSYLLSNGGQTVTRAFHKCSRVDAIMDFFDDFSKSRTKHETRASVSNLALPETSEVSAAFQDDLSAVKQITECFLPGFKNFVTRKRLAKMLKMLSDILPPLSQADTFRICVWLPILAEALQAPSDEENGDEMDVEEGPIEDMTANLIAGLTDIVTSANFDVDTRSAAGSCLFAVVVLTKSGGECPVAPIVANSISPTLGATLDPIAADNALKIGALLGAAAGCRGGVSAPTADKIAKFFLEVACHGKAELPFSGKGNHEFNCAAFEDETMLGLCAASAYGSMLTVSTMKPLMTQRLLHASSKFIKEAYEEEREQARTGLVVKAPRVGLLLVVSYVICNSDFERLDRSTLHQVATLVVEGLSSQIFQTDEGAGKSNFSAASKNLVLAATLKTICAAPTVVSFVAENTCYQSCFLKREFPVGQRLRFVGGDGSVASLCSVRSCHRNLLQIASPAGPGGGSSHGRDEGVHVEHQTSSCGCSCGGDESSIWIIASGCRGCPQCVVCP